MKEKTERRLEDLEHKTGEICRTIRVVICDTDGTIKNEDGTPYVEDPSPPPAGSRIIKIVITAPPNRPPWTDSRVKPQIEPGG